VVSRGVPVLFVYGDDDGYRRDLRGLASVETQEAVQATIERWVRATFDQVTQAPS
jgi:hypothetical protein